MTENEQNLVDACTDNFDFSKVHRVMEMLDWKWASTDGVPTLFDIKQRVRKDFKQAIGRRTSEPHSVEGTGGCMYSIFRVGGVVVHVKMRFEVATSEWDVEWLHD